jgi:8-oxo-dGTP pyrophosphatase MutT (NUDIX family)
MNHRIRAAALIVDHGRILLVEHTHPSTGETWWVPPGGGVEPEDDSIFACAARETFEETGLTVTLDRIVYTREFMDDERATLNLELFVLGRSFSGELTIANIRGRGPDEEYIRSARWLHKEDLQTLIVYPEILKGSFWDDLGRGFPQAVYLGRT